MLKRNEEEKEEKNSLIDSVSVAGLTCGVRSGCSISSDNQQVWREDVGVGISSGD